MITINPIREFEFRNRIIIPFRSLDSWIRMICFILLDVHLFFFSFFSFRTCRVNCFTTPSLIINRQSYYKQQLSKRTYENSIFFLSYIFTFVHYAKLAVSSYFSSPQNELHPFFHVQVDGRARFFFFFFYSRARCKNTEFR